MEWIFCLWNCEEGKKKIHSSFAVTTLNYNHCIVYDNWWVKMEMLLNLYELLREQERPDSHNFH